MRLFGIYGASGCGRGVLPLVSAGLKDDESVTFVDDACSRSVVNGYSCYSLNEFLAVEGGEHLVCLAVADSQARELLDQKCVREGVGYFSPRANNIVIMDHVEIGEGAILSPFVTLTSNIKIGRHFHANLYSYVEHDCEIGDFVTFAPGVKCNGNVVVEDHAYIGSGAIIKQGKPGKPLVVGKGAVVGMGAVVTRDVPSGETVVGNPARLLGRC